jgi:hypothetical protein
MRLLFRECIIKPSTFFASPQRYFEFSLMIGTIHLELESGVCIPKYFDSNDIFLSVDVEKLQIENIQKQIEKISSVIASWNVNKNNSQMSKANGDLSLKFVKEIFSVVDIQLEFPDFIMNYLTFLKKNPTLNVWCFEMEISFRKKFNQKKKLIEFLDHVQLDQFFDELIGIDSQFSEIHSTEFKLLKSFDDAFYIRYYSIKYKIDQLKLSNEDIPMSNVGFLLSLSGKEEIKILEKENIKNDSFQFIPCQIQKK